MAAAEEACGAEEACAAGAAADRELEELLESKSPSWQGPRRAGVRAHSGGRVNRSCLGRSAEVCSQVLRTGAEGLTAAPQVFGSPRFLRGGSWRIDLDP